jgi:hypothetical protein
LKALTVVKDAIKYTSRLTDEELTNAIADLFGVKKVLVGNGIYNSAKRGKTFVSADIWSDNYVMVAVVGNDGVDLSEPAIGRTILWEEDSPENAVVESYREEQTRSDIFRVRQYTAEKLIDPYFGHLLKVDA